MAAANTDLLKKLSRKWTGQIGAGGVSDSSGATIPLSSTTNLATDTAVVATIDRVDANGTATPAKEESVIGVISGSNLVTCTRGVEGTAQAHDAGAVVEILITAKGYNDIIDALLVGHSQLGAHTSALVTTLKATGAVVNTGTSDVTIVTPKAIADSYLGGATSNLQTQIDAIPVASVDGWTDAAESWAYASATTITVPSGAAAKYAKGDKLKLTQTTVKYFYIVSVADTVLTVTGGSDYTIANAAITLNYYSHVENPLGFPYWFNYTVSLVFTNPPSSLSVNLARFNIIGNLCTVNYQIKGTANGGNAGINPAINTPVAGKNGAGDYNVLGSNNWGDQSSFMDVGTPNWNNANEVRANFSVTTRKPTVFGMSFSYEI